MRKPPLDSILLIDDNKMTNFIHQTYINRLGLAKTVFSVLGGEEGLSLLKKWLEREISKKACQPDLIILDLNMPNMDGYEFLEKYERMVPYKLAAPIVVVSSSDTRVHMKKAKKYKVVLDYKVKPLKKEGWVELVKQLI